MLALINSLPLLNSLLLRNSLPLLLLNLTLTHLLLLLILPYFLPHPLIPATHPLHHFYPTQSSTITDNSLQ